jgi:hypothetical protein
MFCLGSAGIGSPALPPQLVRLIRSNSVSFEQVLSNKLHSSLVIPSIVSKKQPIISGSSTSSTMPFSSKSTPPDVVELQFGALLRGIEAKSSSTSASTCIDPIIQVGCNEKRNILDAYQAQHGSVYPDLIVTKKKGKIFDDNVCPERSRMRPSLDKWYRVEDLSHLISKPASFETR